MIDERINKILVNVLTDGDINLSNTEKLLNIVIDEVFVKNQYHLLSVHTQEIAKKLIDIIRNQPNIVRENFRILHLLFGLSILLKLAPSETIKDQYCYLLAKFLNLDEFSKHHRLVARSISFKNFASGTAKYFFDDEFYNKMELKEQERSVYMYFYLSTRYNGSSNEHMEYMYPELYKVFLKAIELKQSDLVFYLYTPLLYSYNTLATTQDEFKIFNDEVETKLSEYIKTVMIPFHNLKPNSEVHKKNKSSKTKVAFIQERIFNYSINKVFKSLLKTLKENKNDKYEFVILDINFAELSSEPEEVEKIKEFGFKYVDLHKKFVGHQIPFYSTVSKALAIRQYIIDEDFDIIIGGNGRPEFNFLFTTRTVAKQIFWSHGNAMYDVENIDQRISHFTQKDNKFKFDIFTMPIDIEKYNPKVDMEKVKELRENYPKDAFILGSIGRLVKVDSDEYLETVSKIMKQNPNTIYLACGPGDRTQIQKKVEKLAISDRFYFTGKINAHIYGHIIDLYLSPFPMGGGEALDEYRNKGKSYVAMHSKEWLKEELKNDFDDIYNTNDKSKILKSLYDKSDLDNIKKYGYLIPENNYAKFYYSISNVTSKEIYINVANRLINDSNLRRKIIEERKFIINNTIEYNSFIKVIND